ncbi:MAG TPA: hypothetical protein VHM90_01470 [Phycisphaerae bacterium]|nr:hypothetical protein [Phycisphaerae bacterium]
MKEKDIFREVRNPRHIPGIYNYCDRWCERCAYTLRCANFAIGQKMDADSKPHEREKENLWPRLAAVKGAAEAILAKHADHPGVGVAKTSKFGTMKLERHRLGAAAMRYMKFAHEFIEKNRELDHPAAVREGAAEPWSRVSVAESFDVIAWDHTLIAAKTGRATRRSDEFDEEMESHPDLAGIPSDRDGTGKVVLLCIDRSIVAWAVMMTHLPVHTETALSAMLTLHRLRVAMEREIPKARGFVREGFDTVRFPAK